MSLQAASSLELQHVGGGVSDDKPKVGNGLELGAGEQWLCVQSAPHKEIFVAHNLVRQEYRPFVPKLVKKVRHARQTKTVTTAFFPRYLFVILDPSTQRWRPINGTFGVTSLIMENGLPKAVPDGVVESLIEATDEAGTLDFSEDLNVGQKVRLSKGPFTDLTGTLARLDDHGRVAVLLNFMGGERLITTKGSALQPAAD